MRLHSGSSVPPFRLPAIDGSEFDLRTTAGTRLFLAFFRFATCPFCNLRMHELVTRLPELGGACRVVAIFDSPVDHLREHAGRHEAPFPVLADPRHGTYRAYGVERSVGGTFRGMVTRLPTLLRGVLLRGYWPLPIRGDPFTMPAEFLIDRDGTIATAHYGQDEGDHLPFKVVRDFAIPGGTR